jgi:hypothetical protein
VKLFAALDLPPVDPGNPVNWRPVPSVSSCPEFVQLLAANSRLGQTTVAYTNAGAAGELLVGAGQTCIRWAGWNSFDYDLFSECTPLHPAIQKSALCANMLAQFNEACARHEAQHQRDFRQVLGTEGPSLDVTECVPGTNLETAQIEALKQRWNARVSAELKSVIEKAKEALHQTANGGPVSLSSHLCEACFSDVMTLELKIFADTSQDADVSFSSLAVRSLIRQASTAASGTVTESASDGPGMARGLGQ